MLKISYFFLLPAVIFVCSSCSNEQYQILFQQKKALSAKDSLAHYANATPALYHIQPGDLLQIRNLQDKDAKFLTNISSTATGITGGSVQQGETFQVAADSTVDFPAVGKINMVGLTRVDAQNKIQELYAQKLLLNPIIELKITNLKVTILGESKGQGNFPLVKDRTTLVELIGEAGGLTDRANEKDIKIIRGTEQKPKVIDIDLSDIGAINSPESVLQSGDIIYIAQNKRAVRSDNLQSFSTVIQPALLLFNTALIILTLVRK